MSKLVRLDPQYWPTEDFGHWCPGCGCGHEIAVTKKNASGASWSYNGDPQKPTFAPSINIKINHPGHQHYRPGLATNVCHYFIRDGKIEFLGDCTHALRGQTVDLPDIPEGKYLTSERL